MLSKLHVPYLPVLTPKHKRPKDLHPLLPLPKDLFAIFYGGVGSGKTQAMLNLVLRSQQYRDFYPGGIYVFSPTAEHDDSTRPLRESSDVHLLGPYSDEKCMQLFKELEEAVDKAKEEGDEPLPSLLVMDDCVGDIKEYSQVATEVLRHRHRHCGVIILTQLWKGIPTKFRANASMVYLFKVRDDQEMKKIQEAMGSTFGNLSSLMARAHQEPHDFLLLFQGRCPKTQAWRNFCQELLYEA
nr:ATPase/DNA packaging protein [Nitrosomonas nitrosa]